MIEIRPAMASDLEAVAELDWRALHEPFESGPRHAERKRAHATAWCRASSGDAELVFVAREGQTLVGFAAVRIVVGEAELDAIAVAEDGRRRGLGRAILQRVVDELAARGVAILRLEVRAGNAAARALYATLGFSEEGLRARYYASGEDAVLYVRGVTAHSSSAARSS